MLKFFRIVVFNFLTLNDDAHLKNFTLLEYEPGDYRLSPAYDLLNTSLHLALPSVFALKKGLLKEGMPERLDTSGVDGSLFGEFGKRIGLPDKLIRSELDRFCADYPEAERLIEESVLPKHLQENYLTTYNYRKQMLKWGRGKQISERRKQLGISQQTLADLAGVGINTLVAMERGTGNPSLHTLLKVLDCLGLVITIK